jgi:NAD(P)-dependent dehydrogenase (short-subunit alcohol dehydrogenase family)
VKSFENKVAAITGAGSGIGRALALALAAEKCDLAISDVNEAGLAETAERALKLGVKVTSAKVDVAKREQVQAWAAAVKRNHGKVNLVFNNAGVAVAGTVEGLSYEEYEWIMGINFWGVVNGTKEFLPLLRAGGDGHVINISSIFGIFAQPSQSAYNASKFAVRGFTESLRQELDILQSGVSATCVHPGGIKTNIARDARLNASVRDITGADPAQGKADFEKMFITTPETAAQTILRGVRRDARRVLIGPDAKALDLMQRLLPTFYQWLVVAAIKAQAKKQR